MTRTEIHTGLPAVCIDHVVTPDPHSPAVPIARGGGAQCRPNKSRAGSPAPRIPARIIAGRKVLEVFDELVHGRVNDVLPILKPGENYDAADLCGSTFMASLTPGRQLRVGACLADRAARGAFPLTPLRDGADGALRYRLTQTPCSRGECSPRLSVLGTAILMLLPDGASRRCRERRCKQLLVPRPIAAAHIQCLKLQKEKNEIEQ